MTSLAEIQTAFQDRMLTGSDAVLPLIGGGYLGVYEHAYTARLLDVLAEDFPALHTLLGDERFAEVTRTYVGANPSRHPSIRWLGARLPSWIATTEPWSEHPELADMAGFEWALGLAFDAPDAPALSFDALAAVSPEAWHAIGFVFHPSLQRIDLTRDVVPFRQAVAAARDPEAAPGPLGGPEPWAAWRDPASLTVRYDRLDSDEAAALDAARTGVGFGGLCERVAETGAADTAAVRAATMLRGWIERGWISGLSGVNASWA